MAPLQRVIETARLGSVTTVVQYDILDTNLPLRIHRPAARRVRKLSRRGLAGDFSFKTVQTPGKSKQ